MYYLSLATLLKQYIQLIQDCKKIWNTLFDQVGFSSKSCNPYYNNCHVRKLKLSENIKLNDKNKQMSLLLLHLLDGDGQVDGFHGDLDFAYATKEISDEDTSWVPQKKVSTVARSRHTLTLGTYFELRNQTKQRQCIRNMQLSVTGGTYCSPGGSIPLEPPTQQKLWKYCKYLLMVLLIRQCRSPLPGDRGI